MIFTLGNILTLTISLTLIVIFRQLDKNNRSLEKAKKYGDKLRDDLDLYIKERSAKLDEAAVALEVQQTKAVAAVKRLDSIREELARKEEELMQRTQAVGAFGKQIETYDATIKQLLEMTALAETNLSKITAESDFADSLGKKLMASQKQLAEISSTIPSLQASFTEENRKRFEEIHAQTLERISANVSDIRARVDAASAESAAQLSATADKLKDLYQKAYAEAARRADALEDGAFVKLKEQASERLVKYKEAIEEKTLSLQEATKERLLETQQLAKTFKADWQAEAAEFLEATRAEIRQLAAEQTDVASRVEERLKSVGDLAETRAEELSADVHRIEAELRSSLDGVAESLTGELSALDDSLRKRLDNTATFAETRSAEIVAAVKTLTADTQSAVSGLSAETDAAIKEITERLESSVGGLSSHADAAVQDATTRVDAAVTGLTNHAAAAIQSATAQVDTAVKTLTADTQSAVSGLSAETGAAIKEITERLESSVGGLSNHADAAVRDATGRVDSAIKAVSERVDASTGEVATRADAAVAALSTRVGQTLDELSARLDATAEDIAKRQTEAVAKLSSHSDAAVASAAERSATALAELSAKSESSIDAVDAKLRDKLSAVSTKASEQLAAIGSKTAEQIAAIKAESHTAISAFEADAAKRLGEVVTQTDARLAEAAAKTAGALDSSARATDERLLSWSQDLEYRLARFDDLIADTGRLDVQLRQVMDDTQKRVTGEFESYTVEQQSKLDAFSKKLLDEAASLTGRMQALETGLNELKSRAYDNVSAKLKLFEDDFFADLKKRSDSINAELERWKANVDERLDLLGAESESARKASEDAATAALKERLTALGEQYRAHTAKLEDQIAAVEGELRARITASDQSILAFTQQYRAEFEQARSGAEQYIQGELDAQARSVQESIQKQQREVDLRTKALLDSVEAAKTETALTLEGLRSDFAAWQTKTDQQFADAGAHLDTRLAKLDQVAKESIGAVEAAWQAKYRDFVEKTAEERRQLKDSLDVLKKDISLANAEFDRRSAESLSGFEAAFARMTGDADRRLRESAAETDRTVQALRAQAQELRDGLESNREKLFQKLQSDTGALGATLEEIDRKQKAFIAQTRVFDRADELKASLESGIESLKRELSQLDVWRDAMGALEQQYAKIRKVEEDSSQKVARFMSEKKRIDILETDFNKLLALSDSMDKKIAELTGTNDDLQQYQVQIRRFEETLSEVNARYDRLEKKAVVLDQTVDGVDKAFDGLKSLEAALAGYRDQVSGVPDQLAAVKAELDALLENRDKTALTVEKLSALDDILADVEARTAKMQTAREWLARTETRLEEISKKSQDQLKLLGDIMKDETPGQKSKGAPPIGIRENVVKLAHQGWKVDEIARALHLSRGEVELILELPQK